MDINASDITSFDSPFALQARALYHEAFPEAELVPEEELFPLIVEGKVRATAFHDAAGFLGATLTMSDADILYVVFLAASPERRGKGAGGSILDYYQRQFPHHRQILELETLTDPHAPNPEQRSARERFYLRHGFHYAGFSSIEEGGVFDFLVRGGEVTLAEVKTMIEEDVSAWEVELVDRRKRN
ncbi:GNAT superfamily N-acetyltransferase [Arcanobacterium wilhelmae]|uniref:GNAT superfamily N-acetyltransferase n=1 Tax=Arcanobacterium wilhelmae TaxID=1803177 RepID=A0ABT9NCX9_9ACTO|nr:GNAT family N-acetyltransferase [Arcanobacterium wilhelmae]MDP9801577.1 GNAT superfamily N-acetyltransferase [Arcanobacterium wilhelmae]WFN90903.1 GNAT family N-acetyltransferase [Arcanobacterium wilhelmae]